MKISDAIAVVTGGGSGIGRALAMALADRGARHVVVADVGEVAAVDVATAVRQKRTVAAATAIHLDVTDAVAVAAAVAAIEADIGPIGLWFSNAGVSRGRGRGSPEDWNATIGVNLLGHVHGAAAVLPLMAGRAEGHFIVTASAAGLMTGLGCAPYCASNALRVAVSG